MWRYVQFVGLSLLILDMLC